LPNLIDHYSSKIMYELLEQIGINLVLNTRLVALDGNKTVRSAIIEGESPMEIDMVIMTTGIRPQIGFLMDPPIRTSKGIVVDDHMRTTDPSIYAAGDVAETKDIITGFHTLCPIWPEAVSQGEVAGLNMAGVNVKYEGALRRNVFQVGHRLFLSAGRVEEISDKDQIFVREGRGWYRKLIVENGRLVGVVMVDNLEFSGALIGFMKAKRFLKPEDLRLILSGRETELFSRCYFSDKEAHYETGGNKA
jgi:NAD(P)H-nitrite reductase large subunit